MNYCLRILSVLMLCIAPLLVACSNGTVQVGLPAGVTPTIIDATREATPSQYAPPVLRLTLMPLPTATNTPEAGVVYAFFNALNAGKFDDAIALLDESIRIGDCDFQAIKNISFDGKLEAAQWLRARIAENDHFFVSKVLGGTLEPRAFGIDFDRRTNDALKRLEFPNGIRNQAGAKVILTSDLKRLDGLALGPGPLSDGSSCRPEPYR